MFKKIKKYFDMKSKCLGLLEQNQLLINSKRDLEKINGELNKQLEAYKILPVGHVEIDFDMFNVVSIEKLRDGMTEVCYFCNDFSDLKSMVFITTTEEHLELVRKFQISMKSFR